MLYLIYAFLLVVIAPFITQCAEQTVSNDTRDQLGHVDAADGLAKDSVDANRTVNTNSVQAPQTAVGTNPSVWVPAVAQSDTSSQMGESEEILVAGSAPSVDGETVSVSSSSAGSPVSTPSPVKLPPITLPSQTVKAEIGAFGGSTNATAYKDGKLYVAKDFLGLEIYDAIGEPRLLKRERFARRTVDVEISGDFAYVLSSEMLAIMSVSDAANPFVVGALTLAANDGVSKLAVEGNRAFILTSLGIMVIDISSRANPKFVTTYHAQDRFHSGAFHVQGGRAYIVQYKNLEVVHLADSPVYLGTLQFPDYIGAVSGRLGVLYVATSKNLALYDVSKNDPMFLRNVAIPSSMSIEQLSCLNVFESAAYMCNSSNLANANPVGIIALDTTNLANPSVVSSIGGVNGGAQITVAGASVFHSGLLGIDVVRRDGDTMTRASTIETTSSSTAIELVGSVAYVGDSVSGLLALDVSTPAMPVLKSVRKDVGQIYSIKRGPAGLLYVAGTSGLHVLNTSDPTNLSIVGSLFGFTFRVMAVDGNIAYVASGTINRGLYAVDIANPLKPSIISSVSVDGLPLGIEKSGHFLYLSNNSKNVTIFDVSNPAQMIKVGSFVHERNIERLAIKGQTLFGSTQSGGIALIDISNKAQPSFIKKIGGIGGGMALTLKGDTLYSAGYKSLDVYSVANERNPSSMKTIPVSNDIYGIEVESGRAYLSEMYLVQMIDGL